MKENEKPLQEKFWTIDMIGLAILNIVLLTLIVVGIGMITIAYAGPFRAWLNGLFGI